MHRLFNPVLWVFSLFFFFAMATAVHAKEAPDELLRRVTNEMITSLKKHDADIKDNSAFLYRIIDKIIVPYIDWSAMSAWVVGRNAWMQASPAQRSDFVKEFQSLLIHTYANTLRAYNNQTIDYLPIRGGFEGKSRVQVASLIKEPGRETIRVNYRMADKGDTWKVYDISIEGVSLLKGFQSQFSDEVQQSGLDSLIERLKRHNAKNRQ